MFYIGSIRVVIDGYDSSSFLKSAFRASEFPGDEFW
jgi:hypothetical protein